MFTFLCCFPQAVQCLEDDPSGPRYKHLEEGGGSVIPGLSGDSCDPSKHTSLAWQPIQTGQEVRDWVKSQHNDQTLFTIWSHTYNIPFKCNYFWKLIVCLYINASDIDYIGSILFLCNSTTRLNKREKANTNLGKTTKYHPKLLPILVRGVHLPPSCWLLSQDPINLSQAARKSQTKFYFIWVF